MPAAPPVSVTVTVSQKDIDRITKRLDKWQGAPLQKRMEKAVQGGLALLVNPIRSGAGRHRITGKTAASVRVRKLRKISDEIFAYKVGPTTRYAHFVIAGTSRGVEADPYVDEALNANEATVMSFIDEQVKKVA